MFVWLNIKKSYNSRIRSKEIKRPKMLALDLSEADSHPEIGEARKTSEEGEEVRLIGYR